MFSGHATLNGSLQACACRYGWVLCNAACSCERLPAITLQLWFGTCYQLLTGCQSKGRRSTVPSEGRHSTVPSEDVGSPACELAVILTILPAITFAVSFRFPAMCFYHLKPWSGISPAVQSFELWSSLKPYSMQGFLDSRLCIVNNAQFSFLVMGLAKDWVATKFMLALFSLIRWT